MIVTGWGKNHLNDQSDVLLLGRVRYLENSQCESSLNALIDIGAIKHNSELDIQDGQMVNKSYEPTVHT